MKHLHISFHFYISMQVPPPPTEDDEASIPTENVRDDPNLNRAVKICRKAAKRTLPWDLTAEELDLVSQDEYNPARKKQRLEEPLSTTTDEAAGKTAPPNVSIGLPPDDVNVDPVTDTQPHAVAIQSTGHWTTDEDVKLTSAVANTFMKMWGNEYKKDWDAVAALVPGRTLIQCRHRWKDVLDPKIYRTTGRRRTWTEDEDSKLKDAVQTHGGKNWSEIAVLVPDRSRDQCHSRWRDILHPSIDRGNGRIGKWIAVEDSKLKDAVKMHGGKDWDAITALVPGRTKKQCRQRWNDALDPSIDRARERWAKWTAVEDSKLKDAVQTHGGKNWGEIAAVIPGRTQKQCWARWHDTSNPSIDRANKRIGKWAKDEDIKLKDAVQTHGGKSWGAIAELVPGRTKRQCCMRWMKSLDPNRSTVIKERHVILNNTPALGQDRPFP